MGVIKKKRKRASALQNALRSDIGFSRSVLECASPFALCVIEANILGAKNQIIFKSHTLKIRWFLQLLAICFIFTLSAAPNKTLDEANASYNLGEQATTYEERKTAFNKALLLYSQLEETIKTPFPPLDQALGDTYFQLGEYPWAILYYQRSLQQNPNQPLLLAQLEKTKKMLGLPADTPKELHAWVKQMKPFLSFFHRFHLLYLSLFITFGCLSCAIWLPSPFIRNTAIACTFLSLVFLGIHAFEYYSQPLEGILIQTSGFYRAPDKNQTQLTNQPLMGGTRVQIVQMTKEGSWLKIMRGDGTESGTENGTMGYVPTEKVRPIKSY